MSDKTNIYIPRFSFEITDEQQKRLNKHLNTYGIRKPIFSNILDDVLDIIEEYGPLAIGLLVSGKVKPREIIPTIKQVEVIGRKS